MVTGRNCWKFHSYFLVDYEQWLENAPNEWKIQASAQLQSQLWVIQKAINPINEW